jgi:hypothetical protein
LQLKMMFCLRGRLLRKLDFIRRPSTKSTFLITVKKEHATLFGHISVQVQPEFKVVTPFV